VADRVVVVGGGLAGLAAAATLAEHADVRVIERLPAPGGTWEFDHPAVKTLVAECLQRGVTLECGDTALRWVDRRLLVIGPGRREWVAARHLVFAGGTRPATPAELPLLGARTAGVFVATVAHHLLTGRVDLGAHVALCGGGYWAELVSSHLPSGTHVTFIGDGPAPRPPAGVSISTLRGHTPVEVTGHDRVETLVTDAGGRRATLRCDAVVLAGDIRPLRNVDGAIREAPDVTYVQLAAATVSAPEVVEHARKSVSALTTNEENP